MNELGMPSMSAGKDSVASYNIHYVEEVCYDSHQNMVDSHKVQRTFSPSRAVGRGSRSF